MYVSISIGATGFTTRSDIGPAKEATDAPEQGTGPPSKKPRDDDATDELNDNNYDEVFLVCVCI